MADKNGAAGNPEYFADFSVAESHVPGDVIEVCDEDYAGISPAADSAVDRALRRILTP